MKIECDKCSAKYSIADEKVRGKTFKIRCKKCSNVIIVRDKSAAAAADAGGGGAEPAADQTAIGWHLAINGETVGPMPEEEVRQRYDAGEIDKDTAIWQEGFEDWVPLGDVDVFADLPEQPAAPGDDPFASANQDDYAAAGAAGAAAAMGGAAAAAAASHDPEAQSPRVSSLTGQRNENSVLFSLDSLQQIAQSGGAGAPAAGGGGGGGGAATRPAASTGASARGLATAAPGSEGSGLIDIRALGAMVGSDSPGAGGAAPSGAPAGAPQDDAALPSFGGAGLGGLASTPLVPQPSAEPAAAAAAAAAPPPARSNAPLYVLMVVLIVAVAGLGAFIFLNKQDPVIVEKTVQAPPPSVAGAGKDDEDEDEDEDEDKDDEDEDEDEDAEDEDSGEGEEAEDGSSSKGSKKKKRGSRRGSKKSSKSSSSGLPDLPDPKPSSSKSSSKKDSGDSDLDVDCILDPAKCGKGASKSKPKQPTGATDPNLPEKLSTSDIKAGIAPVKSSAKSCGTKHNAPPGTKVKVKISISGKTGTVTSATAQSPHTGTPLGNCVASAVKKAKFKKFRKSSLGAVYPFRVR